MERRLLYAILISCSLSSLGQWDVLKRVSIDQKTASFARSIDGNLYLGLEDGSLVLFNPEGEEILNYSLNNQSPITLIDPQFQLKTCLFYFDNQLITILDRFNTIPKEYPTKEFTNEIVSMSCPAPDGTFWILENNPVVLKRVDPIRKNTLLIAQPVLGTDIQYMRTYQNLLLVLDELGLHVFDQFGNLMYEVRQKIISISIQNNSIYCLLESDILEVDLSNGYIQNSITTPLKNPIGYLRSSNGGIFISDEELLIYVESN